MNQDPKKQDPRKKLYDAVSSKYDIGTFDEFNTKMDSPQSRKKLYESVSEGFDLGSFEEFESKISPVEKKNLVDTSPSTTTGQNLGSEPQDGSLVSPQKQFENKPVRDERGREVYRKDETGNLVPVTEKVEKGFASSTEYREAQKQNIKQKAQQPIVLQKQKDPVVESAYSKYKESSVVSPEAKINFEKEFYDKKNNKGFWNSIESGARNMWNGIFDEPGVKVEKSLIADETKQAVDELQKEDPLFLTPERIEQRAKEIYIKKQTDNLRQSQQNKVLESLPEDVRKKTAFRISSDYSTIDKKVIDKKNAIAFSMQEFDDIEKDLKETERVIKEQTEMGNEITPELAQYTEGIVTKYNSKVDSLKKEITDLNKSKEKLGEAEEEFDDFKRIYDESDVAFSRVYSGLNKMSNNIAQFALGVEQVKSDLGIPSLINEDVRKLGNLKVRQNLDEIDQYEEGFRKRLEEVNNVADFANYVTDVAGDQLPNMVPFIVTGGTSGAVTIFASGYGAKLAEMQEGQITQNPDARIYSKTEKVIAPFMFGISDAALSQLPTYWRLKSGARAFQSAKPQYQDLIKQTALQKSKDLIKKAGKELAYENLEELGAMAIQNSTDVFMGVENAHILNGVGDVIKDTSTFAGLMQVFPMLGGGIARVTSKKEDVAIMDQNAREIIALSNRLEETSLSEEVKKTLRERRNQKIEENNELIKKAGKKIVDGGPEFTEALIAIDNKRVGLLSQADEIQRSSLSNSEKKVILADLEKQYLQLQDRENRIKSEDGTVLDYISEKESLKLKNEASRELVKEAKDSGKENFKFTDEEITKRAVKIYNKNKLNEKTEPITEIEPKPETQPQAEKQTEVVEVVKSIKDRFDEPINTDDIREGFVLHRGSLSDSPLGFNSLDERSAENYAKGENEKVISSKIKKGAKILKLVKGTTEDYQDNKEDIDLFYQIIGEEKRNEKSDWAKEPIESDITTRLWENKENIDKLKKAGIDIVVGETIDGPDAVIINENSVEKYETTQGNITSTNAGVQPRIGEVGAMAVEQKPTSEVVEESSVQPAKDSRTVKTETVKYPGFANKESEAEVDFDESGNITQIRNKKTGKVIEKYTERQTKIWDAKKQELKKVLVVNANYSKIEAAAYGQKTNNQINIEDKAVRKQQVSQALDNFSPTNEYEAALEAFARGNKVSKESLGKELGNKDNKWATNQFSKTKLPSIEVLSEQIAENYPQLDQAEIRNALIDIIQTFQTIEDVENAIIDSNIENNKKLKDQELAAFLGNLTEQELAVFEANKAEEDYFSELTDEQVTEYYQQKLLDYEQGKTNTEQRGELEEVSGNEQGGQAIVEGNDAQQEGQKPDGGRKSELDNFINKLDQLDKDLANFGNNNLSMGLPIVISRGAIKAMKLAAQTAKTIEEIVTAGVEYVKNTDWYKNLSEEKQATINEKVLENLISAGVKTSIEADKKIQELRDKIKDGKLSQKQIKDEVIQFVSSFSKKGYFTPTQSNALIKKALEIFTKRDATKAFNDFMDYYEVVIKKAELRENPAMREAMKYEQIKSKVLEMIASGMDLNQVLNATEVNSKGETVDVFNYNEKKDAQDIFIREEDKTITPKQALEKVKKSNKELYDMLSNAGKKGEVFWNKVKDLRTLFFDRQSKIKTAIKKAQFDKFKGSRIDKATERIIATNGASSYAEHLFNNALDKIYNKGLDIKIKGGVAVKYETLTSEMIKKLDEIIALRRIIAIDKSREERGLKPVKHPNNGNIALSEKALQEMETELGPEVFKDLNERAGAYFNEFRKILDMMVESGLISKETRDDLESIDYSPRKFVKFLIDGETGEISQQTKDFNRSSAGLSSDQIQSLEEGDITPLINNSRWLLGVAFVSRARAMFQNDTNKKIISEFKKLETEYETLKNKPNKTKSELKKIKEFEQLKKTVDDNPIIGFNKNNNPVYEYESGKTGFTKAYYYIDGVQHQFLLENNAFDALYGNVKQVVELGIVGKVFSAPGTLVKALATGRNPMFLLVNIPRDFVFTQLISQEYSNIIPYSTIQLNKDLAKGITAIATKNDLFENYLKYGGGMSFLSTQGMLVGENKLSDYFDNEKAKKAISIFTGNRSKKMLTQLLDFITVHELNYYSELMFRLAVFDRAINNRLKELKVKSIEDLDTETQKDVYYSAVASARSILDFNQGGSLTKAMEPYAPYINASTQGIRSLSDALRQDPKNTTIRMAQLATIPSLAALGFSYALIATLKDDEDERTVTEIYLDNKELMSKHHKKSSYTVDLGVKNEKGMPRYLKIAKEHQMMPFSIISEHYMDNYLRRQIGRKEVDDSVLFDNFKDAFFGSAIPVDVRDPKSVIAKNPLIRSVLTYDIGYDFYRNEFLSPDINKKGIEKSSIGFNMDRVEDFYKVVGEQLDMSPLLLKAGVESIITSPETNPHIGMIYGGLDVAVANKDVKDRLSLAGEKIWKNMGKRLFGEGSEYNKSRLIFDKLEKEFEKINTETRKFNAKIDDIVDAISDKEITPQDAKKQILEKFKDNPERIESAVKRIENRILDKDLDPFFRNMKYVPSTNAEDKAKMQALMLYTQYGNLRDRDKKELESVLEGIESVLGKKEIERLVENYVKLVEIKETEGQ